MRLLTVVGARPQFIKLAPFFAEARRRGHNVTVLHTGQHYDASMSARFFSELALPEPDIHLEVGSLSHAAMTARALEGTEAAILERQPDAVVVFGDTNSTLAGALAAAKLAVSAAHVEAGLRSFVPTMPEEINRVLADHCCSLLLAPNPEAMRNLEREGLAGRAVQTGDIMVDSLLAAASGSPASGKVLASLGIAEGPYSFLTLHRAGNTDDAARLSAILEGLSAGPRMVFPVHPRTRSALERARLQLPSNISPVEPLGYLDTVGLMKAAMAVVTDSGGLQKEAYLLERPCVTLREETEWNETVELGWNVLVGADPSAIAAALANPPTGSSHPPIFGDGFAASAMLDAIERHLA